MENESSKNILTTSENFYETEMVEYPYVFEHKNNLFMLYNGNAYGKTGILLAKIKELKMEKFDKSEGYGVIDFDITKNESEIAVEEIKRNGFAKIKSNFTNNEINSFSKKLDIIQKKI